MVKVQDACNTVKLVSASAVLLISVCVGFASAIDGSVENVLAGLSSPDLNDYLADIEDYQQFPVNQAPEYNGEYTDDAAISGEDYFLDSPPPQALEDIKHVEQRADVRADVPKHAGLASQQKAAHSPASAVSAVLPAYCDPPNPCPLGYTSADGCIEGFENTSEFSRRYQSTQNCICDTEHMFNCPSQATNGDAEDRQSSSPIEAVRAANEEGFLADMENPYLTGEKLHVAAKKGLGY